MKNTTIYIRTLKRAEHTVFCVADGQKSYYDAQFNRRIPFSSGQQVKRSIVDNICEVLNVVPSPTTFLFDVVKQKELKEGEVYGTCDPTYVDQLFGGWMKAAKGGTERTLKRRSPLSISAMRGLHPLLAGVDKDNASFDRSDRPNNEVIVRDEKGNTLSTDEIVAFLEGKDRSLSRKWIPDQSRASGLFVSDIAIDLRRLFTVSLNSFEPEVSDATIEKLKTEGWKEVKNVFGDCLVAPKSLREEWSKGLAHAIVNWKITSNQSRTFSLMDTLALSISNNANLIAGSIRAKLVDDDTRKAEPIVDESIEGVETFISLQAGGYVLTKGETVDAMQRAEQYLIDQMMDFDYENQL
ncbi:hypothetical protein [Myroides odoratimimus]|uniref:hypothetical protein n=1 Tax=Myroides odoratimimus TaxID=76832 RepID=UPI000468AC2B|nr:hypothetical protein [Myroides odoratimimus]